MKPGAFERAIMPGCSFNQSDPFLDCRNKFRIVGNGLCWTEGTDEGSSIIKIDIGRIFQTKKALTHAQIRQGTLIHA